jgi:hypothetical protein
MSTDCTAEREARSFQGIDNFVRLVLQFMLRALKIREIGEIRVNALDLD